MAIRNCRDRRTADFFAGRDVPAFRAFARQATKALTKLQAASRLVELSALPSNRFEALRGDRKGQFSIRVNDRWRVCFEWNFTDSAESGLDALMRKGEAHNVEIVDYH